MQIFHNPANAGLPDLPADFPSTVVSVGNYDGVHLGHRFLLARVVERAHALRARSLAVTFEPHPTHLLRPGAGPRLITPTLAERLDLLATTGIDATAVLPFTAAFSQQSAEAFARNVLLQQLRAVEVHEGDNFRFGHRARAGVDELRTLGSECGFAVHIYKALQIRGMDVSSSLIRQLVSTGDMRRARWLLGRPFSILSTPAHGRGIGSRLTVPTINFAAYDGLVPAAGVYVTRMQIAAGLPDARNLPRRALLRCGHQRRHPPHLRRCLLRHRKPSAGFQSPGLPRRPDRDHAPPPHLLRPPAR